MPSTRTPATAEERRRLIVASHPGDHRFFSGMAWISAAAILGGFGNTYAPKVLSGAPALPGIIHVHAVVFTAWVVLFVAQTSLVSAGRTATHRRLGVAATVLVPLMLVLGVATAVTVARLGHRGIPGVEFPTPDGFLLLNVNAALVFAILAGAGWYFRKDPQTHKRLMLTAQAGALVGPGVSRLPVASGRTPIIALLVMAFLLAGPVYDLATRRRVHRAYWAGVGVSLLAVPPVVALLASTPLWQRIAEMMLR